MLEKIKQEIVVIIISISSMIITAFATIYGVQITNEHNLKMQDRQVKIENARKEIEKREEISKRITQVYSNNTQVKNSYDENKESIKELREVGNDLLSITINKEIYEKFKEFMRDCISSKEEKQNNDKLNNSYSSLMSLIMEEKIKYQIIINTPSSI